MNEIICPNCKKAFKVDEAGFADILKQVRDHKFEEELKTRLNIANKEKESAVKLAEANVRNSLQEQLAKKIGTTKSYISKIENDIKEVRISSLERLVEIGLGGKLELRINL